MSRSINIARLLSVYQTVMDDDNMRINFVKYIAETHPRLLIKFSGRDDESEAAKADAAYERMEQELKAERFKHEQTAKDLYEVRRRMFDMTNELNALKNPVRNDASDVIKVLFEKRALEDDNTFGTFPNAPVRVSFVLHDNNKKITTIKWCREHTGYGLAEAKGWSEGNSEYDYHCTYSRAVEMRDSFRMFARLHGHTGVIYIKGVK